MGSCATAPPSWWPVPQLYTTRSKLLLLSRCLPWCDRFFSSSSVTVPAPFLSCNFFPPGISCHTAVPFKALCVCICGYAEHDTEAWSERVAGCAALTLSCPQLASVHQPALLPSARGFARPGLFSTPGHHVKQDKRIPLVSCCGRT